jgi:hypothetical protein
VAQGQDQPPVMQKVQTGQSDGTSTEIVSGLTEGDWVARPVFAVKVADKLGFSFMADPTKSRPGGQQHK